MGEHVGKSTSPSVRLSACRAHHPDAQFEEIGMEGFETAVSAISSCYWRQPSNNF